MTAVKIVSRKRGIPSLSPDKLIRPFNTTEIITANIIVGLERLFRMLNNY